MISKHPYNHRDIADVLTPQRPEYARVKRARMITAHMIAPALDPVDALEQGIAFAILRYPACRADG